MYIYKYLYIERETRLVNLCCICGTCLLYFCPIDCYGGGLPCVCCAPVAGSADRSTLLLSVPGQADLLALGTAGVGVYRSNVVGPGHEVGGMIITSCTGRPCALLSDTKSHCVRRVDLITLESTVVAGAVGCAGHRDGEALRARFQRPLGLAELNDGSVIVCDSGNHCIRILAQRPDGSCTVTTLAGTPKAPGCTDGVWTASRFLAPGAIAALAPRGALISANIQVASMLICC